MLLTEEFRPHKISDIVGQNLQEFLLWGKTWSSTGGIRCAMLYGNPGTGKTSACYALANELGWETLECNCSEIRTPKDVIDTIKHAIVNQPWQNRCLIILDECDGFANSAYKKLEDLIERSVSPIVLTCNDEYSIRKVTRYFKSYALMVHFKKISDSHMRSLAQNIANQKHLQIANLDALVAASHGDARYCLTNLETSEFIETKFNDQDIFAILHDIFQGKWNGDLNRVEGYAPTEALSMILYSLEQNIYNFYDDIYGETVPYYLYELQKIYNRITPIDKRTYRFMPYIVNLLKLLPYHQKTARIEISKGTPKNIRNHWFTATNSEYIKLERYLHVSYRKIIEDDYMKLFKAPSNWEETARPSLKQYQEAMKQLSQRLSSPLPLAGPTIPTLKTSDYVGEKKGVLAQKSQVGKLVQTKLI